MLTDAQMTSIEILQALIDQTPQHPYYDIVIDRVATATMTDVIVIGWRGAVRWTSAQLMKWRDDGSLKAWNAQGKKEPPAEWGMNLAMSAVIVQDSPENVMAAVRRLIDRNFVESLSRTNLNELGMGLRHDRWIKRVKPQYTREYGAPASGMLVE